MSLQLKEAFVTLATLELETLILFYSQLLEIEPNPYLPKRYAEFQLPGLKLGIFKPKDCHQQEFLASKSRMSLCLEVGDLEQAIAHLTTLGYPPSEEIQMASHGREIYAYDPDGNRLILHQSSYK